MLNYTKTNTSDDEVIDVFNVNDTQQIDFMDAFNNVVEVGAVKSIQLTSGGIPVEDDAGVTYTVTNLIGNGDGDGEMNQRSGRFKSSTHKRFKGLISQVEIHSAGAFFSLQVKQSQSLPHLLMM